MKPKCAVGRPKVGFSESIPVVSSSYYGTRLKFYLTNSGPRARFQFATDIEQTTWEDDVDEYAPDSSDDPTPFGATVNAAGITIASASTPITSTPSNCQNWKWNLSGSGNIPLDLPRTARGSVYIAQNTVFDSDNRLLIASHIGNGTTGRSCGLVASSTGRKMLHSDGLSTAFSLRTLTPMVHADMVFSKTQDGGVPTFSVRYYVGSDSTYQTVDTSSSATSGPDLTSNVEFRLLAARYQSGASGSCTGTYEAYLYWSAVP